MLSGPVAHTGIKANVGQLGFRLLPEANCNSTTMIGRNIALAILFLVVLNGVSAQRDGRRRSGRRKPTTTSAAPDTEPTVDLGKSAEPELAKPSPTAAADTDANILKDTTDSKNDAHPAGPQYLAPRGMRKPRPTGQGARKPKPTLPTFVRKSSGRTRKITPATENSDNPEENVRSLPNSSTVPRSTRRPPSQRRRNNAADTPSEDPSASADTSPTTSPKNKKRFGGGNTRRPSRGNRRPTTEQPTEDV